MMLFCACGRAAIDIIERTPMCADCAAWWNSKDGQSVIRKMDEDFEKRLRTSIVRIQRPPEITDIEWQLVQCLDKCYEGCGIRRLLLAARKLIREGRTETILKEK